MRTKEFIIILFAQLFTTKMLLNSYSYLIKNEIKSKKSVRIVSICIISFLLTINNMFVNNNYKAFLTFIIMIISYKVYFKSSIKTCIVNSIIILFISVIIELFFSALLLINVSFFTSNITLTIKILLSIIVYKSLDLVIKNKRINKQLKKLKQFMEENILIETILLIGMILMVILLVIRSKYFDFRYLLLIIIIFIIYICMTVIEIIKNRMVLEKIKAQNYELISSYNSYTDVLEQYKILKHNLKNDLYTLKVLLPVNKQKQINNIVSNYIKDSKWINKIESLPKGIQGLVYLKRIEAQRQKINLIINIKLKKQIIKTIDFPDICTILSIILDNAIEASVYSKSKNILLDIHENDNKIIMSVSNSFTNSIDLDSIGNKGYSTKKIKSGIGLNYLSKINKKNINISFNIINNIYIAKIQYTLTK